MVLPNYLYRPCLALLALFTIATTRLRASAIDSTLTLLSTPVQEVIASNRPIQIVNIFYMKQSPHFLAPRAPRFLLVDQKERFALGIGGYVRLTTITDFDGISASNDFLTATIPTPNSDIDNGQTQYDVSASRLFLQLVGSYPTIGDFSAYVETDFRGVSGALRLRQAYVEAAGWLAGRAWSIFFNTASFAPSIDSQGANAATAVRHTQLRYQHTFDNHWQAAIALESPEASISYADDFQETPQRIPAIPLYLQYNWGTASNIRLSAIARGLTYHYTPTNSNKTTWGWGTQLSGVAQLSTALKCYYQATFGEGIANYVCDLTGASLDLAPLSTTATHLSALPLFAYMAALQYNISSTLFTSATYSQVNLYDAHSEVVESSYKRGQYLAINLFKTLFEDARVGLGYIYGIRVDADNERGSANRLQASVQYNF